MGGRGRHSSGNRRAWRGCLSWATREKAGPLSLPLRLEHSGGALTGHSALMAGTGWATLALPGSLLRALG